MHHEFDLRLGALKAAYNEGQIVPRQLIAALRDQAAALNPEFNLFIHLLSREELEPYLAALDGKSPAELPLYGVPFAIKDNIDLAGVPTTAACPAFAYVPEQSATLVEQLIALGAVPVARPTSTSSPPASTAPARPTASAATACTRTTPPAAPAPAPPWPWPSAWPASPSAPTPQAAAGCRRH